MEREKVRRRSVVLPDFYGEGKHIYNDQMGWTLSMKKEAGSLVSKEIFKYHVVEVGLNLAFYYPLTDTFYGIHSECYPIECKILPRDKEVKYLGLQCKADTHDDGEVIASFDNEYDIWDNLKIAGHTLEQVIAESYIMALN